MNLLIELLIWGVAISLVLIPVVRWFWKFWDRPSADAIEIMQQRQDEKLEEKVWLVAEQAEREAEFEKLKWIRKPPARQLSGDEKSDALDTLDQTEIELEISNDINPQMRSYEAARSAVGIKSEIEVNQGPLEPPDPTKAAEAKIMAEHRNDIDELLSDDSPFTGSISVEDDFWYDIYW